MSRKISSYCVTIYTHTYRPHALDSNFIHTGPGTAAILQHLNPHLLSEILIACRVIRRVTHTLAPPIHKCKSFKRRNRIKDSTENISKLFLILIKNRTKD